MTHQNIIERITKLLALANDSAASSAEAELALKHANRLLAKHNLSMTDVSVGAIQKDISETEGIEFGVVKEEGNWETMLMSVIANHNFCQSINHTISGIKGGTISVVGKAENVEIVIYQFEVARNIFRKASKNAYNTMRKQTKAEYPYMTDLEMSKAKVLPYRMPWIRAFLKGAVLGLNKQLSEQKKQMQQQSAQTDNKFALVVTNTNLAIENYLSDKYKNLSQSKTKVKIGSNQDAYAKGYATGKSTKLSKAIKNGQTLKLAQ